MKKLLFLLFVIILFSCEKDNPIDANECMLCTTITKEDGMIIDIVSLFVCGEDLIKRQNTNWEYVNEFTGNLIVVKTVCVKEDIK